ncbi:MAG: tetratricopeptide repeat protein [Planctomycetes bacterium]|nr:tetratricopeptide repeat protein [Planctomycetota bacterium]
MNRLRGVSILSVLGVAATAALVVSGCQVGPRPASAPRPEVAAELFVQSQLRLDENDETAALAALLAAVQADPELSVAHAAIGDIYRQRGDYPMAVRSYERAVEVNAWDFRNHYNCASLHQALASIERAADAIQRHLRRAIELYQRAIVLDRRDYDSRLNLGVCHFQLGQYDQAAEACRQAIALNDAMPEAYTNLGVIYHQLGRNYDAIAMYNKSLERDGLQPLVLMNLGDSYIRVSRYPSAIRSYQQALELAPASATALERLGFCHYFTGDYARAREYYQSALAADERLAPAHRGLGIVCLTLYLQDRSSEALRQEGLGHLRTSLQLDPEQPQLDALIAKYGMP